MQLSRAKTPCLSSHSKINLSKNSHRLIICKDNSSNIVKSLTLILHSLNRKITPNPSLIQNVHQGVTAQPTSILSTQTLDPSDLKRVTRVYFLYTHHLFRASPTWDSYPKLGRHTRDTQSYSIQRLAIKKKKYSSNTANPIEKNLSL